MPKVRPFHDSDDVEPLGYLVRCPGCGVIHALYVRAPNERGARWTFSGDIESPTFSPSLLHQKDNPNGRCHSFIKAGFFEYLPDCHHRLAGNRIEIPEWPLAEFDRVSVFGNDYEEG